MIDLSISGNRYRIQERVSSSAVLTTEIELLEDMIEGIDSEDADPQTLPPILTLDGIRYDTDEIRRWIAVGIGESSSWVSDLDVLKLIVDGGLTNREPLFTPRSLVTNFPDALELIRQRIVDRNAKEEAMRIQNLYKGKRGLMVVDVVASRQRQYEAAVVGRILPEYKNQAKDLGLGWLSNNNPDFLRVRNGETDTMKEVAAFLKSFAEGDDDELAIQKFVSVSDRTSTRAKALSIKGIGPVLYEYLRLLSGADTIKIDSRVRASLRSVGIPQHFFSDQGLLDLCKGISQQLGCSLVELDQALWIESGS